MSSDLLVSCIMPTTTDRDAFRETAFQCFESQTWQCRELVVVEDAGSIGQKRNMAVSRSAGEIIVHWDDDDWSAPERIADQVRRLLEHPEIELTGYHSMVFHTPEGIRWKYLGNRNYALGTSFCYRKSLWRRHPFADLNEGEDNKFLMGIPLLSVDAGDLMWARIHAGNTSAKRPDGGKQWQLLSD